MAHVSQPSPLSPARQRALALASSGDVVGARAVLERAVELGKVNLAEDDPDVLRTAFELGSLLQRIDDPAGARRVLEEAYAAGQWRLGDADPLMVEISHGIGLAAQELGNRHEARKAFGRVAEYGPAVLGDGHWAVAGARAYLGDDSVRGGAAAQPQVAPVTALEEPTEPLPVVVPSSTPATPPPAVQRPLPVDRPSAALPQTQTARPSAVEQSTPPASPHAMAPARRSGEQSPAKPARPSGEPAPRARRSTVEPPSPANQRVWTPPARRSAPARGGALDEATAAQPIIKPRPGTAPHEAETVQLPAVPAAPEAETVQFAAVPAGPEVAPAWVPAQPDGYAEPVTEQVTQPDSGLDVFSPTGGYPHLGVPLAAARSGEIVAVSEGGADAYRKGIGLFAAIAAVLAALIAVAALVFVLANRSGDDPPAPSVPTLGGDPPGGVQLRDGGSEIDISWTDPSPGTVSFMVTMGHPGELLKPVATLGPGKTSYQLGALNPTLNYCFTVVAVYQADRFATSPQTCTSRASATPR
jgi:hypothetical protein